MIVSRLAPSPTGSLHLGNVRTFLWAWLSCRSANGMMVLRVEDLETRGKPGVVEKMLDDLQWLGLNWDEGPVVAPLPLREGVGEGVGARERVISGEAGPNGPYIQSQRRAFYTEVHSRLRAAGLIYPCICTRADIAASQSAPHEGDRELRYPGTCRERPISEGEIAERTRDGRAPAWRLKTQPGAVTFSDLCAGEQSIDVHGSVGDFVIAKASDNPAYQLAVVVDDIAAGVNEVVRGDDLIPSTARQILLYDAIAQVLPQRPANAGTRAGPWALSLPRYGHVPLVVGPDGKRTAKRHGDARIADLRARGVIPERIIGVLARWSGLDVKGDAKPAEIIQQWSWDRVTRERVVLTDERLSEL